MACESNGDAVRSAKESGRAMRHRGIIVIGINFTERLRKVLGLARQEAERLEHEHVDTEHLLLGLIREGEGVAAAALKNLGINLGTLKAAVEDLSKPDSSTPVTDGDLPYTSPAKKVLELAMRAARELNHDHVGTQHVLIALIREENGIAALALHEAGVTEASVHVEVLRLLGTSPPHDGRDA